jgi:hypothetical protein
MVAQAPARERGISAAARRPARQEKRTMTAPIERQGEPQTAMPVDIARAVRDFNASNESHENLWTQVHRAGDVLRRGVREREAARHHAREARDFHLTVQAEFPHRHAPLVQQWILAGVTVGLDAVACWFAAQALGSDRDQTLLWTALFLAVLAGGEAALDHYSERGGRPWRLLVAGLAVFVAGLGVLRFLFLATVGTLGVSTALVGAMLFTGATASSLALGYRALRAAEKFPAWRARKRARYAEREAARASDRAAGLLRERDRLVDAYLSRIRVCLLTMCLSNQLPLAERAVREHLIGQGS